MQYSVYVRFKINGSTEQIEEIIQDFDNMNIMYFKDKDNFFVGGDLISKVTTILESKSDITYKVY